MNTYVTGNTIRTRQKARHPVWFCNQRGLFRKRI